MYKTILVPVENRQTDETILQHIRPLARLVQARLILVHVADGWVARNFDQFQLQESEEMKRDRAYLARLERNYGRKGLKRNRFWPRANRLTRSSSWPASKRSI